MPTHDRNKSGSQSGRQNADPDKSQTQSRDTKQSSGMEDREKKSGMTGGDGQQKSSGSRGQHGDDR